MKLSHSRLSSITALGLALLAASANAERTDYFSRELDRLPATPESGGGGGTKSAEIDANQPRLAQNALIKLASHSNTDVDARDQLNP